MVMEALANVDQVAYVRFASVYKNSARRRTSRTSLRRSKPAGITKTSGTDPMKGSSTVWSEDDVRWMRHAICLARRSVGDTAESGRRMRHRPQRIVTGRGRTQSGGRPHAEVVALEQAGSRASGATAYVTLEPCAHYGKTPPCADALIQAGIDRVVCAVRDPDPRVNGGGFKALRTAGLRVEEGCLAEEAREPVLGFLSRLERGRPWVTAKLATSLDGRIATASGHSQWITGPQSRERVQRMRAESDAVMTGAGTVRTDDPQLTVRVAGLAHRSPVRVVVAGGLPLDPKAKILKTATEVETRVYVPVFDTNADKLAMSTSAKVIEAGSVVSGQADLLAIMSDLAGRGIGRVLVEAGGTMLGALLANELIDEIAWFRAPIVLGGDAQPVFGPLGLTTVDEAKGWKRQSVETFGHDLLKPIGARSKFRAMFTASSPISAMSDPSTRAATPGSSSAPSFPSKTSQSARPSPAVACLTVVETGSDGEKLVCRRCLGGNPFPNKSWSLEAWHESTWSGHWPWARSLAAILSRVMSTGSPRLKKWAGRR